MGSSDLGDGGEVEYWRARAERLAADNVVLRSRVVELEGRSARWPRRCRYWRG